PEPGRQAGRPSTAGGALPRVLFRRGRFRLRRVALAHRRRFVPRRHDRPAGGDAVVVGIVGLVDGHAVEGESGRDRPPGRHPLAPLLGGAIAFWFHVEALLVAYGQIGATSGTSAGQNVA